MDKRFLFFCICFFQSVTVQSFPETREIQGHVSSQVSILPLNGNQLEHCYTSDNKEGRCMIKEDCVFKDNTPDYVRCNLKQPSQNSGVCCPIGNETLFNNSSSSRIQRQVTDSTVTIPEIETVVPDNSLQFLGETKICGYSAKTWNQTRLSVHPWMVALLNVTDLTQPYHFCGGAVISKTFVLTAAHCFGVTHFTEKDVVVRVGEHDLTVSTETIVQEYNVSKIIVHEHYDNRNYKNDIALLVLEKPMNYSTYVRPICFPPLGRSYANDNTVVTGWGDIKYQGPPSKILKEVDLIVQEHNECQRLYSQFIQETEICAGFINRGKDSCKIDSGGPLIKQREDGRWEVIGIVSYGDKCGIKPGIYTRVNKYLDWIAGKMQTNSFLK